MKKFFKRLWSAVKKGFNCLISRTFLFLSFVFVWVIPILLLHSKIKLVEVGTVKKLTGFGLIVGTFIALKFYGKFKAKIERIDPKNYKQLIWQFVLLTLQKIITFGLIAGVFYFGGMFFEKIADWFMLSLIPIGIGFVFSLIDRQIMFKKRKAQAQKRIEKFKEKIKEELRDEEQGN